MTDARFDLIVFAAATEESQDKESSDAPAEAEAAEETAEPAGESESDNGEL